MRTFRVGGLNRGMKLFPAIDKSDAPVVLENVDPSANLNLVSRMGITSVGYVIPGGEVHSIGVRRGASANRYYVSGAGGLYRDGATLLASGFGTNEFVQFSNVANNIWAMNRTKAVRDDGTTTRDWLPAAPGAALTAALQTRVSKSIADFAVDNTWLLFDATGTPVASANITYATESPGGVVRYAIPSGTRFETVLSGITRDLSLESEQRADDIVRISIRVDSPDLLSEIELILGAGFVDPEDNYYRCVIPSSVFTASPGQWVDIEIRRGAPEGDPIDPPLYFTRTGNVSTQSWATISSLFINVTTTAATEVAFGQWEIYGGVSGPLKGDYEYYYTHVDDAEGETNPSPVQAISVANQPVLLTLVAAPAGVTKRHIYRGGGTQNGTFRVHTLAAGTNTVTDTTPEDIAVRLGAVMEEDHDPAPLGRGVAFGEGRLCVFSPAAQRNLAVVSKAGPGYSYFPSTNELLIGDDDEDILAAHFRGDSWVFWKERSIHRVDGTWPGRQVKTSAKHGILGVNAVCEAGGESGGLFFYASDDGIYSFNMEFGRKLSQDLDPLWRGQSVDLGNVSIPPINTEPAARSRCVLAWARDRLIFAYPAAGESNPTGALVYHLPTERWSFMRLASGRHIRSMFFEGTGGDFLIGSAAGDVWADNDGFTDAGSAIAWIYQGAYMDLGVADLDKTINDVMFRCNMGGGTATVKLMINDGASEFALGSLTGTEWEAPVFQSLETGTAIAKAVGNNCRNFAIRLEGTAATGAQAIVSEFAVRFEVQAREAEDFDSQWWNGGTPEAKEVRALRLDIDNAAAVTWAVQSDVSQSATPTPGTAERDTGSLTETGNRRMVTVPMPQVIEGHQFRYLLAGKFRLWAMWAYVRTLGFFVSTLDAARGHFWESAPIRFPFIAEVRRVKVTYRSGDVLTMGVLEDYPAAQVPGGPTTFPVAAAETVKYMDRAMTLRTARITMSSPKHFRLYDLAFELKPIAMLYGAGEGGGYDSGWRDFGTQKLKQFESLRLDIINAAAATVTISRDGAADLTFPITSGARRAIIIELGNFRSKQIRIQITSAGEFSLYGGEVWLIPFGRVVESGAPFQPDHILIPNGAVALFSEVQVDADCTGDVTVAILTNQPGGVIATRYSAVKTFAGRAEKTWKLPDGIRGGLWTIQVSVAGQTIVRAVKVRLKIMGQAGRTDWVWANVPVETTPPLASGVDLGIVGDQPWRDVQIPIEGGQQGPFQWVPVPVDAIE